ncbi:MAG: RdgB/HAM1 family non-canonical purine NTP pyrophosphatase [Anaerolineales bacterium]|nr:RdgB/HAM1 family non-canonical purine NTP pyrophosphatase [Anaerolineales bacterium]
MNRTLLVATHNQGKILEYRELLADLPLTVTWLDAEQIDLEVAETGTTFAENAALKAETYARLSGHLTWADDSGLEVDALDGAPGVFSARYGGPGLNDVDRYRRLLAALSTFGPDQRTARFRCVVAIAVPAGPVYTVEGAIEGVILDEPRGAYGFGYDPVFYVPAYSATMAELLPAVKNRISHRALAAISARRLLREMLGYDERERKAT